MRYVTPSQVRMAIHSIAAVILKTCQRVIPSMNVSVRPQGEQNCCPETKPHRLRSGYTCCHDRGNGTCRSAIVLNRTCVPLTASVCCDLNKRGSAHVLNLGEVGKLPRHAGPERIASNL